MNAHSVNLINNDKPVVVCCGDSITHGHIGYDWVSSLRRKDGSKIYINAGINADLTWNLNQRINDIIKHNSVHDISLQSIRDDQIIGELIQ